MKPYYADETVTLYHGDALDVLRDMPDGSVGCCVTSPPYYGLRDYGVDGQYGLEASPAEYVAMMRAVFAEVRRVLADDGTLWLNIGDSYSAGNGDKTNGPQQSRNGRGVCGPRDLHPSAGRAALSHTFDAMPPAKNLLGIPWRVAFALQDDGWILRSDIVWAKPNGMPESVTDRLSSKHEYVFLLAKSRRYWFDLDAVRVPTTGERCGNQPESVASYARATGTARGARRWGGNPSSTLLDIHESRNPGDVWTIPTSPFPDAHYAVMAPKLAERCILAGCKPGGVVLDPFSGAGTTGMVAGKHGRRYVGIDLDAGALDLSLRTRLRQGVLDFEATP